MKIVFVVAVIFFARLLAAAWFDSGRDADLVWQNWLGMQVLHTHHLPNAIGRETFSAPGSHWVPQEWAFSTALAWATEHGHFAWIALASAFAATLTLLVAGYRAFRRGASTIAMGIAAACVGFSMIQSFGARAQVFGWLCLSLLMLLLDLESGWSFLAIPIVAVWANLHASAAIAPVLAGAWAVGTLIEDRAWTVRVRRSTLLALGCGFALLATPLLWELPGYAVMLLHSPFRNAIEEWQPSNLVDTALYAGVLPLLAIACYFGIAAPRERWRDGMLLAITAPLAFMAVRHLPICAITIAPMAAQRLSSIVGKYARVNVVLEERFSEYLLAAGAAIASIAVTLSLLHTPAIVAPTLPRTAVARLAALPGEHNLFCEDFAWCSLALPTKNVRAYLDGRCDPYPARIWKTYISIAAVHPDWDERLTGSGANAVLVRRGRALAQALSVRSDWHLYYSDRTYELFLRSAVQTAER